MAYSAYENTRLTSPTRPSRLVSCVCPNCHETVESTSGSANCSCSYLTTPNKPPVPCRQKRSNSDFSPEHSFYEKPLYIEPYSTITSVKRVFGKKSMRDLNIPLPLPKTTTLKQQIESCPKYAPPKPRRAASDSVLPSYANSRPPKPPRSTSESEVKHGGRRVNHSGNSISNSCEYIQSSDVPVGLGTSNATTQPKDIKTFGHKSAVRPIPNGRVQQLHRSSPSNRQTLLQSNQTNNTDDKVHNSSQWDVTLPSLSSKQNRKRRAKQSVRWWIKAGTMTSYFMLIGLVYMVTRSVRDTLFKSTSEPSTSLDDEVPFVWEPPVSRMDTTVCLRCEIVEQYGNLRRIQKGDNSELYRFTTVDHKRHCCLDQLGHMKWMVNLMKTREMLLRGASKTRHGVRRGKMTRVHIQNVCSHSGESTLQLNTTDVESYYGGARVNVTRDSCVTLERGTYIVYLTLTVDLQNQEPQSCDTKPLTTAMEAHLQISRSDNDNCIEMERWETADRSSGVHAFNFYVVKEFEKGDSFFPVLSHPSYLYATSPVKNYIEVVRL